jgi:hypothetical protein
MVMVVGVPQDDVSIALSDFIAILKNRKYDMCDRASLFEVATHFRHLSNNKTFLVDVILNELCSDGPFQAKNVYGPTVFMVHTCEDYFIRANLWRPISELERSIEGFRYDICHDHNFDILTVGYFGPGYRARTYSYDASVISGVLGERIAIKNEGEIQLTEGKMMLYKAKRDIHIQLPPKSLSISLNFIPRNKWISQPQYQFDEDSGVIVRYLHSLGNELTVRMAGVLGDDRAFNYLDQIRRTHPSPHLRALAAVSQARLRVKDSDSLQASLSPTRSSVEKHIFEIESREPGASLREVGAGY